MTDEKGGEEACSSQPQTVSVPISNWWSPWVDAAKSKSTEVYEFFKKDLNEISTAVKSEASTVVHSTATALKDTFMLEEPDSRANIVKRSVSTFLGSVGNVLNPLPEDDDAEAILIQNDAPVSLSKMQVKTFELVKDKDTFLVDIDESLLPQFESWLGISEDLLTTDKLTKLLVASPDLHNQYETLVPEYVSHITFWKRFLFRKALLEDEESRKEAKEKREKSQAEQIEWDKEDFAENIELSEEDQVKILSEYENEKKKKSKGGKRNKGRGRKEETSGGAVVDSVSSLGSSSSEGKDTSEDWETIEKNDANEDFDK